MKYARKFIQISDTHLFGDANQRLLGVDTGASLKAVIELVAKEEHVTGILATGDVSQDKSLRSYQRFAEMLRVLDVPVHWIPGNHDDSVNFHQRAIDFPLPERSIVEAGNWRILMLDSVIPGDDAGHLARTELDYIEQNVRDDGMHYLLVLHHQPVPCGCDWLDTMIVDNSDEFVRLISAKPSIRAVLNGHIHQSSQQLIAGITYISAPSTCFQFTPHTSKFSLDSRMPGYRRLLLKDDGSIETDVFRVVDYDMNLVHTASGY